MRNNINLHLHIHLPQLRHPQQRPNRLMLRHPLGRGLQHGLQRLIIKVHVIGRDAEDLVPACAACVLEIEIDVCEGLFDLGGASGVSGSRYHS